MYTAAPPAETGVRILTATAARPTAIAHGVMLNRSIPRPHCLGAWRAFGGGGGAGNRGERAMVGSDRLNTPAKGTSSH